MINLDFKIRRWFWNGINSKTIELRLKELEEEREKLRKIEWEYTRYLFGSKDLLSQIDKVLENEIEYYKFYQEYHSRKESEPNFNCWVLKKKEEIVLLNSYDDEAKGEQHVKTNGKIKAIIQFDRTGKLVKISLTFKNDSKILYFIYHAMNEKRKKYCHLKNVESIKQRVIQYKKHADQVMRELEFPRYEGINEELRDLKIILCVEE